MTERRIKVDALARVEGEGSLFVRINGREVEKVEFRIFVDPDIPLPSSVFSRENERAAGKTVRALRARLFEGPRGTT